MRSFSRVEGQEDSLCLLSLQYPTKRGESEKQLLHLRFAPDWQAGEPKFWESIWIRMGLEGGNGITILDALQGNVKVEKAIRRVHHADILPSDISLSSSGLERLAPGKREVALKEMLMPLQSYYDFMVIDTPPALNLLTINAYAVSNFLIIPMSSDILSLVGLSQLRETIDSVKQGLNKDLKVLGILLNKFDKRTTLAKDVEEMAEGLAKQISTKVFRTKIRQGVAIAEAPAHGEDIFSYNKRSPAVKDYEQFVQEVAEDIHLREVIGHGKEDDEIE